ncbi:MAG TPA: tRNA pseudouridine(55) synthase TruB [Rubrivivax sp.]|nr:tRNA pseudouridine(55) synthase TruB [Rubrivivax sp.]
MAPAAQARLPRRALHGVLLVDKPLGWTSHDALRKAMALLRAAKGGHTGTLDPLATGLLPLAFGAATKFAQVNLEADKRYRATLRLGERTSTGDGEGEVVERRDVHCSRADIEAVLARLTGAIEQLPPMHSAVKFGGKALYDYARAGIEVERTPRRVTIHRIDLVEWEPPQLVVDVHCSKGTYIRVLAEDIGRRLGCGATLAALQRSASGPFDIAHAITIDALAALDEPAREARLQPVDALLAGWPALRLPDDEAGRFLSGLRRRVAAADAARVRVYASVPAPAVGTDGHPRAFLGSAHITAGELIADRLLCPLEVQAARA